MGLDSDPERKAAVVQRASLVAMSGAYGNTEEVERRLVALGYREAPRWLDDPDLRQVMDRVCAESRAAFLAHGVARAPGGPAQGARS